MNFVGRDSNIAAMEVQPQYIDFMRRRATEGVGSARIIRELFETTGPISPFYLVDYFMTAFFVEHRDVMPYLNHWWHEPSSSDWTDEELDSHLNPVIAVTKNLWQQA